MITCKDGCYYIAVPGPYPVEKVLTYQSSLIEVLKVASMSELFDGSGGDFHNVLELLELLQFTGPQISELLQQDLETVFSK